MGLQHNGLGIWKEGTLVMDSLKLYISKEVSSPLWKGGYEETIESDDWCRIREEAVMLCHECRDKYV